MLQRGVAVRGLGWRGFLAGLGARGGDFRRGGRGRGDRVGGVRCGEQESDGIGFGAGLGGLRGRTRKKGVGGACCFRVDRGEVGFGGWGFWQRVLSRGGFGLAGGRHVGGDAPRAAGAETDGVLTHSDESLRQRHALAGNLLPLASDLLALGAADQVEQLGGGIDLRIGADEGGKGEHTGVVDGGRVERACFHTREHGGGFRLVVVVQGLHVALVVTGDGGAAHVQAELLAQAPDDLGIREVFFIEPGEQLGVLRGGQLLEPGIGADFARDGGGHGIGRGRVK